MPKFEILEFDNDYRTCTGRKIMEFEDRAAAEAYCNEHSWSGYDYDVGKEYPDPSFRDGAPPRARTLD